VARGRLTVLNVAYSLAVVGPGSVGGAEQVLSRLDEALAASGHRSVVVACEGSEVKGELWATPAMRGPLTRESFASAHAAHRRVIAEALDRLPVDLVHMHGVDFHRYLPPPGVPVLVTLHLPPACYPPEVFALERPGTYLHCVSNTQRATCPPRARLLPTIENGVPVSGFPDVRRHDFVLALGRICPEKGYHLALDAARRAHVRMCLAGQVQEYPEHRRYFREEIRPRLDGARRFVGPVRGEWKRWLLSHARCLLVPSLVSETSSLVAMEALACGTPVVAFPAGALSEIVEPGVTGFLVSDAGAMADAIAAVGDLNRQLCNRAARARFSATRMTSRYLARYRALARMRDAAA
jgi:glycosyltransferase involved in cell wall biosynthesis